MTTSPVVIGRYQVVRRLGAGGMGSVFLARDPELDRSLAIKLVKDDLAEDAELRERFVREARSAARLRHPNIITVFDIGEHEGRPFIAMEYIPGESLADVVKRRAPIDLQRVLSWMECLCSGLSHAHRAGIVHRDVKPANLMVDADGVLKIVDFGIARLGDSQLTRDGMLVGTANYMAPEQLLGSPSDHRADIFAVGSVFYELLTFNRAFPGTIADGLFNRICNELPEPLDEACPGLDAGIQAIVSRALEKNPGSRYQDLESMAQDIAAARARIAVSGGPVTVGGGLDSDALPTLPVATPRSAPGGSGPVRPILTPAPVPVVPVAGLTQAPAAPSATVDESESQRRRRADVFIDAAEMAFATRDFAKCLSLVGDAARFDPSSPLVAEWRAKAERAVAEEQAARQRQADAEAALVQAAACLGRGDVQGARSHFERARAADPSNWNLQSFASRLQRAEVNAHGEALRERGQTSVPRSGVPWLWIVLGLAVVAAVGLYLLR
jgi:predicted Ser/Thr protein kinase